MGRIQTGYTNLITQQVCGSSWRGVILVIFTCHGDKVGGAEEGGLMRMYEVDMEEVGWGRGYGVRVWSIIKYEMKECNVLNTTLILDIML